MYDFSKYTASVSAYLAIHFPLQYKPHENLFKEWKEPV